MSETRTHIQEALETAPAPLPAPPTERELQLLQRMLDASQLPARSELLAQLRMLQVAPDSDPTTRIYLQHPEAPRASVSATARSKVLTTPVRTPQGSIAGELSLWVDHGHLCALHYAPRHGRRALTLPAPEWLPAPVPQPAPQTPVPARVRVHGAREALAGTRLLLAPPQILQVTSSPPPPRPTLLRWGLRLLILLVALALAFGALLAGQRGGADLAAARSAGQSDGAALGTSHGDTAGTWTGQVEGERAGYASTYQPAFNRARAQVIRQRRQAALKRRREAQEAAAAAAATPVYQDNRTCSGYRDARGYWICT